MVTEVIYLLVIGAVAVTAAIVFAKRGQTDLIRKLISELYDDIDSEELSKKVSELSEKKEK